MKKNERFTDTYNRYGDLIFWYAKRRLSNEELSKECTQQVFLKYYSPTANHSNYWTKLDAEAYLEDIRECLKKLEE